MLMASTAIRPYTAWDLRAFSHIQYGTTKIQQKTFTLNGFLNAQYWYGINFIAHGQQSYKAIHSMGLKASNLTSDANYKNTMKNSEV